MSNPVTNLNGGEFLVFYAAVTLATIIVCCWLARRRDPTAGNDEKHASPELDYDEIAYLRGGEEELARAVIARLVVRGFLLVERNGAGGGHSFPSRKQDHTSALTTVRAHAFSPGTPGLQVV